MLEALCPCCSGKSYAECCQPFHQKSRLPETAEQLMRSRYAAFAKILPDYLLETHHVSTRKNTTRSSILAWAKATNWVKLEIVSTQFGDKNDLVGVVEFKAYYLTKGKAEIHHEISTFKKEQEVWFYVDGKY